MRKEDTAKATTIQTTIDLDVPKASKLTCGESLYLYWNKLTKQEGETLIIALFVNSHLVNLVLTVRMRILFFFYNLTLASYLFISELRHNSHPRKRLRNTHHNRHLHSLQQIVCSLTVLLFIIVKPLRTQPR